MLWVIRFEYNFIKEMENVTHFGLLFNEIFWSKDAIFSLVAQSEDDKEIVFFLDGTSCN